MPTDSARAAFSRLLEQTEGSLDTRREHMRKIHGKRCVLICEVWLSSPLTIDRKFPVSNPHCRSLRGHARKVGRQSSLRRLCEQ